jgi:hypothetical protein
MADSSKSATWVLKVTMDKRTKEETIELWLEGRMADFETDRDDGVVDFVATVIESRNGSPLRIFLFNALHRFASRAGLDYNGQIAYDLFDEVSFEYTWTLDRLETVDRLFCSDAACIECVAPSF